MGRTLYEVLDVAPTATFDQIHRAYLRSARLAHPDAGGSDAGMQEINRAWDVLGDPDRRRAYDRVLRWRPGDGATEGDGDGDEGPLLPTREYAEDLGDDRPLGPPIRRLPILAVVPVAIFAASVASFAVAVALSSRPLLGVSALLFLVASALMVALPFAQMTRGRGA